MASTSTTVQVIGRDDGTTSELVPSYAAPAGVGAGNGNHFDNVKRNVFIHIKNNSGGNLTLTILTNSVTDNLTLPDKTIVISNGDDPMIGAWPSSPYHSTVDSVTTTISLEWSTITSVTFAVSKLPNA